MSEKEKISLADASDKLGVKCVETKVKRYEVDVSRTITAFGKQPLFTQVLLAIASVVIGVVVVAFAVIAL